MSTEVTLVEKLVNTRSNTEVSNTWPAGCNLFVLIKYLAINVVSMTQNNLHDVFLVMSIMVSLVCVSKCRKHILFQI